MYFFMITLHILVAFTLVFVVLIQAGKGGSLGSIFGGGSQAVFGARGAGNFLTKLTAVTAVIFMVTSLLLAILSGQPHSSSIMSQPKEENHHKGKHTGTATSSAPSQSQTPSVPHQAPKNVPQSSKTPATLPQSSD